MRMFAQFFGGEDPFSSFFGSSSGGGGPQIFFSSGGDDLHGFGEFFIFFVLKSFLWQCILMDLSYIFRFSILYFQMIYSNPNLMKCVEKLFLISLIDLVLFTFRSFLFLHFLFLGMPFGMGGHTRRQRQDPVVHHELLVSLEDIYKGCTKKMKITRHVVFRNLLIWNIC